MFRTVVVNNCDYVDLFFYSDFHLLRRVHTGYRVFARGQDPSLQDAFKHAPCANPFLRYKPDRTHCESIFQGACSKCNVMGTFPRASHLFI